MNKLYSLITENKNKILALSLKFGMTNPRIFGSFLEEERKPNDIDILVSPIEGKSYFDLIDYSDSLEDLLGIPVDVVTESSLSPYLRQEIISKAKLI